VRNSNLAAAPLLPILAAGAVSLLALVCCRKSSDALVALYILFGVGIPGIWIGNAWSTTLETGLGSFGPEYLLKQVWHHQGALSELGRHVLNAVVAWGSVTVGCLGLACWRLRFAVKDRPESHRRRIRIRRRDVSADPICWKECYREHRIPLALFRYLPTPLALLGVFLGTACFTLWSLGPSGSTVTQLLECLWTGDLATLADQLGRNAQSGGPSLALAFLKAIGVLILAALTVGVRCATAVSSEREGHTWELLLLTPFSTRELIQGKLQGIVQSAWPYLAAYALAVVPLAWLAGQGELLLTLMTLLLAGPVMKAAGTIGIYQSVRTANSWRSIQATVPVLLGSMMLTVYVTTTLVGCLGQILGLAKLIEMMADYLPALAWLGVEPVYRPVFCFLLVLGSCWMALCWQASREGLTKAVAWVDQFERTPCRRCEKNLGPQAKAP
jgi:hypothetical protein